MVVGPLETNCHIVVGARDCLVVDPGCETRRIVDRVRDLGVSSAAVVLTHGHVDHALGSVEVARQLGAPLMAHAGDAPLLRDVGRNAWLVGSETSEPISPDQMLSDGQALPVGEDTMHVLHTPGHTPGSVCLFGGGILLSGDLIFRLGVGRTDLPGGSWADLCSSLSAVARVVPPDTIVYPGHGPTTTLGAEAGFWRAQGWLD